MQPVLESLNGVGLSEAYVWNNGGGDPDLSVYGRYAAIDRVAAPVILTLDDDVLLPPESIAALIAAYQPGHIVANMPERFRPHYPDSCLVGFGAIFDRDLPARAFQRLYEWDDEYQGYGTEHFRRTCDVVFTTLIPRILLDLPYEDREFASAADRMWKQPGHHAERARMLDLARQVRDRVSA